MGFGRVRFFYCRSFWVDRAPLGARAWGLDASKRGGRRALFIIAQNAAARKRIQRIKQIVKFCLGEKIVFFGQKMKFFRLFYEKKNFLPYFDIAA